VEGDREGGRERDRTRERERETSGGALDALGLVLP